VDMGLALPHGVPLLLSCVPHMRPLNSCVMLWQTDMPLAVTGVICILHGLSPKITNLCSNLQIVSLFMTCTDW